jgi:hypothetical protein
MGDHASIKLPSSSCEEWEKIVPRTQGNFPKSGPLCGMSAGCHDRVGECPVKHPRALVRHTHVARGRRDRAGVADAFKQLGFAGTDPRPGLKNDADPHSRHAGIVPCASTVMLDFSKDAQTSVCPLSGGDCKGFPRMISARYRHRLAGRPERQQRSNPAFRGGGTKVWNRRVSPVAPRPREGPLTEPTAGVQPWPRERVLMPHCRHWLWTTRSAQVAGLPTFAATLSDNELRRFQPLQSRMLNGSDRPNRTPPPLTAVAHDRCC